MTEMAVADVLGRQLTQAVKEPSVVASDKKVDMFLPKAVRNRKQAILPPMILTLTGLALRHELLDSRSHISDCQGGKVIADPWFSACRYD